MTSKDLLRLNLGRLLSQSELRPVFRDFYFSAAKIYQDEISDLRIKGSWIRRSSTTPDFIPAWSDIDLTLLVDDQNLKSVKLKTHLLVKDLQIVPQRFFKSWCEAGGLRNRQFASWVALKPGSPDLIQTRWHSSEVIAFELVHELYLLFFQLERKLYSHPDEWREIAIIKLKTEIERLHLFWQSRNPEILLSPRSSILIDQESFYERLDIMLAELEQSLHPELRAYSFAPLIASQDGEASKLNLEISGKPVMTFGSMKEADQSLTKYPEHFVCSETFLKLIKAVGVQEQTLVNQLAFNRNSYYFHFNLQRLATDLAGAFLLFPDNHSQLYYCFRNIHEFTMAIAKTESPDWQIIDETWTRESRLPLKTHDLAGLAKAYLDVLASFS